ncbi:uncharacterized protein O3C94_022149 [Discoglossus pictus]
MYQDKKMSERIVNHILEILSLLTGKVSQHLTNSLTVIEMNQDKEMSERILSHTLAIFFLLTGEEYTIVKKKSSHIHQLTGESDTDGHKETLGISSNGSSGLHRGNMDTGSVIKEEEDERDDQDIQSCADSDKVTPSGLSETDQEEETNMRSPRGIKEEEIPVNISDGPDTYSLHIVTVKEEEENEREEDDGDTKQSVIHSDPCQDKQSKTLRAP